MSRRYLAMSCVLLACSGCDRGADKPTTPETPIEEAGAVSETDPEPVVTERVRAAAGVAQQGRSLDNETGVGGVIAQPAKALFSFQEKAVFDIKIPSALKLFQASEGRTPRSHDEFMEKIVRANNIQLPSLPEGHRYEFDAETGVLMVLRPR